VWFDRGAETRTFERKLGLAVGGAVNASADGEFGTMASETEFAAVLTRLLATPRPDPHALAAAVCSRFGDTAFSVSSTLMRVLCAGAHPTVLAREQAG
jgi:hypothetical protein